MKKILLLSVVFIAATAAVSTSVIKFTSPGGFFTMMYPENWEVTKNGTSEFVFKDKSAELGELIVKQQATDELSEDYETYETKTLQRVIGAKVKQVGYNKYIEYEQHATQNGKEAIRYYWITGNDKNVITIYYQVPFELRTKQEVLEEQKQVFKTIESLKIEE